jgi:hypothetical protein
MKAPFVDLDSILGEETSFRFKGVEYKLAPVTAGAFMKYSNALARVQDLYSKKEISEQEVIETYCEIISSVCPDFTKEMLLDMTKMQVAALLQLVLDFTQGKVAHNSDVEKKSL